MYGILVSFSLIFLLFLAGCDGSDTTAPKKELLQIKATHGDKLIVETNTIMTQQNYATVDVEGEAGATLFINEKEVGVFSPTGHFTVSLSVEKEGSYLYKVHSLNHEGLRSDTLTIEVIKQKNDSSLGTLATKGEANALTASESGVVFIAEKNHGVEIVSIGYSDKMSSELLASIDSINAQNVILSDDQSKLYIEDKAGEFHLWDITDLSNPKEISKVAAKKKSIHIFSEDKSMQYFIKEETLVGEDTSTKEIKFVIKDKDIKDVVLVEEDSKLLIAHKKRGLLLYDLSDIHKPVMIASKKLEGEVYGLSLIKEEGILFVANGTAGVEIFALDILLHEMTR